jgi:translation initiation factor IF-2
MNKTENKIVSNRPPIVVIMGHIDHGKTKLLDTIKKTNIIEKESGGITQHIGAYEIEIKDIKSEYTGRKITFLDTPGHEAFSKMRERGAKVGDIAVLIVAADEGVKPQTIEALNHILEAKIPYIVAINKIDKPEANPEKVKKQLAENNVLLEDWGGNIPFVLISAKENKNINELLEIILLMADMEDLKANSSSSPSGIVIESKLDSRRGSIATLIIKQGVLKKGDNIYTNSTFGKVKIMEDFLGNTLNEATFSSPVLIGGFKDVPRIGERFFVDKEEMDKKEEKKEIDKKDLEDKNKINVILKADFSGSLEVLEEMINKFEFDNKKLRIIDSSIGNVLISDIRLAQNSSSWILGFRVKLPKDLEILAQESKVKIFLFDVIYEIQKFLKENLEKIILEEEAIQSGELNVSVIFSSQGKKKLVGGKVIAGKLKKGKITIIREEKEIGMGKIIGMQCKKAEVSEIQEGMECGLMIETQAEIKIGDNIIFKREGKTTKK